MEGAIELATTSFPRAEEVEAKIHDSIQFIDQGQNFEDVRCPHCRSSLLENFGDIMDERFDIEISGFLELDFVTPCCDKSTRLNELEFVTPAAFGSFQIDIMNPDPGEIPEGFSEALERELGTSVTAVWCHI